MTRYRCIYFLVVFFCLFLSACSDGETFAPVTELSSIERIPNSGVHRVTKGETLYEIAWRYGLDYRYLAQKNNILAPYTIQAGQMIKLRGGSTKIVSATNANPSVATIQSSANSIPAAAEKPVIVSATSVQNDEREPNYSSKGWIWPAKGKIIGIFSPSNKGINITSYAGEPIYAAAAGKVVYSGSVLRGYGNLIIIKHNSVYLSAYAHNSRVFVRGGDWVAKGQKIAEMGDTGSDRTMLHFEIRRAGKPINPLSLYRKNMA